MSNTIKHTPRIGKGLLKMLMFQMYGDEKLIYREYIQNARDAINDAVKDGLLESITFGCISITINQNEKSIEIRDNGTGISATKVESVLLNIADSDKDGETSAGQFGIGRLVGGNYCQELSFKTSFYGEPYASEIIFDTNKIKDILDDDNNDDDAIEVLCKTTSLNSFEEDKDEHYFIVTLKGVSEEYPSLLDIEIISEYLKEVAPIDYSAQFKNQLINTSVDNEYKELQNSIGHFKISVNGCFIEKRYGLKIVGTDDVINNLEYFSLTDEKYGLLAWGWYALTNFTKAIPTSDNNSHFRLRKHNIQVGDSEMLSPFFPEKRGNKYFYGEIHIVNSRVKLNSARDGLAPTPEGECLKRKIKEQFHKLHDLYHLANKTKNAVKQYNEAYEKCYGVELSDSDIKTAKVELEKAENTINAIAKKVSSDSASKKVFDSYTQKIKNTENLDKKTNTTSIVENSGRGVQTEIEIDDPFYDLSKKYSKEQVKLIRKICDSYKNNCPPSNRKLINELQLKVLKELF